MRDLLLSIIIMVVLPFCLTRPWVGFVTWNWLGMMNPHRIVFGFAQDIPWALMVGAAALIGLATSKDRKPIPWNFQLILIMVITGYFTMTTLFAWAPTFAWERLWLFVKVIVMLILTTTVIYSRHRIRWLLMVIGLGIGYYGIKGGIWVIGTGGAERVHGPANSFISQSNGIGVGLLMVIPVLFALAREEQRKWLRWFLTMSAILGIVSVIFTYSRGAMVGMAAAAPFMYMRSKKKFRTALIVLPLIVAGAMFAPDKLFNRAESIEDYEQDESAMQRIQAWTVAFNLAKDYPFTGGGFSFEDAPDGSRWVRYGNPELYKYLDHPAAAHSVYFQILGQHGFVALGLFLMLMFSTMVSCKRMEKLTHGNPEYEWIGNYASAVRICLIGFMVSGLFLSVAYFDLAWIYCSFTAMLQREMPAEKRTYAWKAANRKVEPEPKLEPNPDLSGMGPVNTRKADF